MALLYHATANMAQYMGVAGDIHPIMAVALDSVVTAPYVLDQLLALAAAHRASQEDEPLSASSWTTHATELQTRALSQFNEAREHISPSNYMESFVFASFLGIHVLHDTLRAHYDSAGGFVSSFVDYVRIHLTVRAVTSQYWSQILTSNLKPLIQLAQWVDGAGQRPAGTQDETATLRHLLESSPSKSDSSESSLAALKLVQWVFDVTASAPPESMMGTHAVMAWPLMVSAEYIDALYQRRPEALAVLAYFAASLHQHRNFWVFGNSGAVLVRLLTDHVGPFWAEAMAWPLQVIACS